MSPNVHYLKPTLTQTDTDVRLLQARVASVQDGAYGLDLPGSPGARRALSCLIEPAPQDLVLVALNAETQQPGHILAVLERPGPQQASVPLPGGSTLLARADGGLRLQASSLELDGQDALALQAGALQMTALTASTSVRHWQGWFHTLGAHAVHIEYSAKTLSGRLGRLVSRILESFRSIEGLDETRAGRSRTVVQGNHQLRAGHINAQAKGFVKIDGQKIDLG